jgi:asparagine synthase (glutamine-hydrolysing)
MFLCAFRPTGEPLERGDLTTCFGLRDRRDAEYTAVLAGALGATVSAGRKPRPLVARWRHLTAVGDVRLDNRTELIRVAQLPEGGSDLEIVLRALDACGEKIVASILGDFAFVFWDPRAQKLIAARDAFGVKPLYYRRRRDVLLFSDRMDAIADGTRFDEEYIADFLTGLVAPGERTIWADVRSVPAGGFLLQRGTVLSGRRFWSSADLIAQADPTHDLAADEFLALLRDGVRARVGPPGATWAQLSGGIDSSSVVALAQNAAGPGQGLAGTITLADSLGAGDERRFVDSVVRRYDLRNEQVRDWWAWQDDGDTPPLTDGPRPLYPFYARDRRTLGILHAAGARVVLSGFGSDHYLTGNFNYITDLAASGRMREAVGELAHWAISTRQSFWKLASRHLTTPLIANARNGRHPLPALPRWVDARFAGERALAARTVDALENAGAPGRMFIQRLARDIASVPAGVDRWPFGDEIEIRYPFLYRPLVEASLRLAPRDRIRPEGTKWILRESMRGLLPEDVRTRAGKGTIDARIVWSLQRERARIDALLRDPILGQLGCVSPAALRDEVDAARRGVPVNFAMLMSALSLETWMAVRSGRWTTALPARQTAA